MTLSHGVQGWLLHAVLNFVVTVSGMALWVSAIEDAMPWDIRYREHCPLQAR